MTTAAREPSGRRRRSSPDEPARGRVSGSTWRRLQLSLTAGLFVVATVTGVTVGLSGAAVSPVAPAAAATVAPAPQALAIPADLAAHGHGHHR